jgi:Xaa-Pro aminopeptidase
VLFLSCKKEIPVHSFMRRVFPYIALALACCLAAAHVRASGRDELKARRLHAAQVFSDGILLVRSAIAFPGAADSYHENASFYYLTGIENTPGATLAIDGKTGENWLFVRVSSSGVPLGTAPGDASAQRLGLEHVINWTELDSFLSQRIQTGAKFYCEPETPELPPSLSAASGNSTPAWIQVLQKKWPSLKIQLVAFQLNDLMNIESPAEQELSRAAARATVAAVMTGIKTIRSAISQREVELAVVNACWGAGANGVAFWPWAMAGANGVFPKPFESFRRYDHLNAIMQPGDLVRLDVGCEWQHYEGDLGRTVPVSGHYSDEQREIWNVFVAAYHAGSKQLHAGATKDQVFDAWSAELLRHRETVKSALAKEAVDAWSQRTNVPFWQIHTSNLTTGYINGPLLEGMVIDFEPIVSISGQGYYLEDMYLVKKGSAEILTPGVPYTAEEIEAAMNQTH